MAKKFQSFKEFSRDIIINIIATIIVPTILWIFSEKIRWVILIFAICLITSIVYLFSRYKRFFKLIKSGMIGYYYTFDFSENKKVFNEVGNSFYYLGVSSNSILEYFRKWVSENHSINKYLFLLINPDSPALKRQVAYEKGVGLETDLSSLSTQLSQIIENDVKTERERISSAIDVLKNLIPYKEGKLVIRLHNEFIPWWMYMIDEKKIYLGIMEKGKRGQESPVMIISKNPDFPSPFDAFKNTWDRMWADAKEV